MNPVDWGWLFTTLAWTVGLAVVLSVFSLTYWQSINRRARISAGLYTRSNFIWFCLGGFMILIGAVFSSGPFILKCTLIVAYAWILLETVIIYRTGK